MISDNHDMQPEQETHEGVADASVASATAREVKNTVQDLLKYGYIESSQKPALFNGAMRLRNEVNAALDPLDLNMKLDELRGLAILRVVESDESEAWEHPLVRRQRLTLEQSFLVAVLRQFYYIQEQENGIGTGAIRVPLDDVLSQVNAFFGDSGSDAKNHQRVLGILDKLKDHGIVFDPDKHGYITIRPLIAYLTNVETLTALLQTYRAASHTSVEVEPSEVAEEL